MYFMTTSRFSMSLDQETVRKIAFLARIDVPEAQRAALAGELTGILDFVEQLKEVDTEGVAPLTTVADMTLPMRADTVTDGGYPDKVLANAPEKDAGYYTVPKVVE